MSVLRPDEKAAQAEIERAQKLKSQIGGGVRTALTLGTGVGTAAIGSKLSSRILPLLSEHIPVDLAIKGISKISPKIGEFLKNGKEMGLDVKEGMNFIKEKMEEGNQNKSNEKRNIIQQYSDGLHELASNYIKKGLSPVEAYGFIKHDKRYSDIIKRIEKDHKTKFVDLLEALYGNPQQQQAQVEQQPQPQAPQAQAPGGEPEGFGRIDAMLQRQDQARLAQQPQGQAQQQRSQPMQNIMQELTNAVNLSQQRLKKWNK